MTTDKRGVSALLLQRQLGFSRYETAWMMLHKLRRAMVNAAREPLRGEVEVDDTWIGGEQAGLRGSRQLKDRRAALVLVAVENPNSRFLSMSSSFVITVAKHPQPRFRPFWVWVPVGSQQNTSKFVEREISSPISSGLLKQPDS
jgi:hypothetical protein